MSFSILYVTFPNREKAGEIADTLLSERIIACVNFLPVEACYIWRGQIEKADEIVGMIKTSDFLWEKTRERIELLHPYETPCIIRWQVSANDSYESWIESSVKPDKNEIT